MKKNPTPIIAFFARGREIGFVILEAGHIIRYGIKTVRGKRGGPTFIERIEEALAPLLEMSGPQGMIVTERPSVLSRTGALCQVMSTLADGWKQHGYPVHLLSLEEAKRRLCNSRDATHRDLIQATVEQYPMLRSLVARPNGQQTKYWEKVFLAAALVDVAKRRADYG